MQSRVRLDSGESMTGKEARLRIIEALPKLTDYQVASIDRIVRQLQCPHEFTRNPESGLINDRILQDFGDALRIHHVSSAEALSKDRFEYALEKVMNGAGVAAQRAPKGNPGHDITIGNSRISLKTQADKGIKALTIHISKYMELGKGDWTDQLADLEGLRERFFQHMLKYERILTLRRLKHATDELYELVEIPKALLQKAATGVLTMNVNSRQNPKPGYCTVTENGVMLFQLYFDGGTERKLQVKDLRKDHCIVHATWQFPRQEADAIPVADDEEA